LACRTGFRHRVALCHLPIIRLGGLAGLVAAYGDELSPELAVGIAVAKECLGGADLARHARAVGVAVAHHAASALAGAPAFGFGLQSTRSPTRFRISQNSKPSARSRASLKVSYGP